MDTKPLEVLVPQTDAQILHTDTPIIAPIMNSDSGAGNGKPSNNPFGREETQKGEKGGEHK